MTYKTYTVECRLKFPSAYDKGMDFEINAKSAADAIKQARIRMRNEGYDRHTGPIMYKVAPLPETVGA